MWHGKGHTLIDIHGRLGSSLPGGFRAVNTPWPCAFDRCHVGCPFPSPVGIFGPSGQSPLRTRYEIWHLALFALSSFPFLFFWGGGGSLGIRLFFFLSLGEKNRMGILFRFAPTKEKIRRDASHRKDLEAPRRRAARLAAEASAQVSPCETFGSQLGRGPFSDLLNGFCRFVFFESICLVIFVLISMIILIVIQKGGGVKSCLFFALLVVVRGKKLLRFEQSPPSTLTSLRP